jgi:hypothetical protein
MKMDKDLEAPCVNCNNYSNWVPFTMYKNPQHGPITLKEAIDEWFEEGKGQTQEEFWYDTVHKPKHYMLFEEEGIEVRDVIEKLVEKLTLKGEHRLGYSGMFVADYVQLMQYLMRFMDKNGVEDLKKARWYLDKLIGAYDEPDF